MKRNRAPITPNESRVDARTRLAATRAWILLVVALPLLGGNCDPTVADEFGQISVNITTGADPAFTTKDLIATGSVAVPSGVVTSWSWSWQVNGLNVPPQFAPENVVVSLLTQKTQVWRATGTATFASGGSQTASAEIVVINSPPVIAIERACQDAARTGVTFPTTVTDADNDPVTVTWQWFVNGAPVAFTGPDTLPNTFYTAGPPNMPQDVVNVIVTAVDVDGATTSAVRTTGRGLDLPNNRICTNATSGGSGVTVIRPDGGTIVSLSPGDLGELFDPATGSTGSGSSSAATGSGTASGSGTAGSGSQEIASTAPTPALSVSVANVCNVEPDGSLLCTGLEEFGVNDPPAGAFSRVEVGPDYACALRAADGGVECWGEPVEDLEQTAPPEGPFASIALAADVACGLRPTGEIACWGDDSLGQASPPEGAFVGLDLADGQGCAIAADGAVLCWGDVEGAGSD